MKLGVVSDLHIEFHNDQGKALIKEFDPSSCDVLVLAGDIHLAAHTEQFLDTLRKFADLYPEVVYVAGNHEFYGSTFPVVREQINTVATLHENFHFLDNSKWHYKGWEFLGSTLWFPDQPDNIYYARYLNDFNLIEDFNVLVYEENKKAVRFLKDNIRTGSIVITHHLPCKQSIHPQFEGSQTNRFFFCDMENLIEHSKPLLWIHGHTHYFFDYEFGHTRVVCNPMGYPHEGNIHFNSNFVIDI